MEGPILHIHNVAWIGGTGLFVLDFARAFPEYDHCSVYLNNEPDIEWVGYASSIMSGMSCVDSISKGLIDRIGPAAIVMHSTSWARVEPVDGSFAWLSEYPLIHVHHIPQRPYVDADVEMYVSEYVRFATESSLTVHNAHSTYLRQTYISKPSVVLVCPPCIDVDLYLAIDRSQQYGRLVTGAAKGGRVPESVLDSEGPVRGIGRMPSHLAKYDIAIIYSGECETWCRTVSECLASGMVVLAHAVGGILEQIKNGDNGFLFLDASGLLKRIEMIKSLDEDEFRRIASNAREWARQNVSLTVLRNSLKQYLP